MVACGGSRFEDGKFVGAGDYALRLWQLPEVVWPESGDASQNSQDARSTEGDSTGDQTQGKSATYAPEPPDPTKIVEIGQLEGHTGNIDCLAMAPSGKFLLSSGGDNDKRVRQWDMSTGKLVRTSVQVGDYTVGMAVLPDDEHVITTHYRGAVTLRDLVTWAPIRQFQGHTGIVRAVAVSPDGKLALTGSYDGTARLFRIETGEQIRVFEEGFCPAVAFSPDGENAAHACGDGGVVVHLWDLENGKTIAKVNCSDGTCTAFAFSPDSRLLATAGRGGLIEVWDVATGQERRCFSRCGGQIRGLHFLPGDLHVVAGDQHKTLRVFDLSTGKEVLRVDCDTHCTTYLAVSPDGRRLATGGGIWYPGHGKPQLGTDYAIHLWSLPESVWPKADGISENQPQADAEDEKGASE